VPEDHFGEEVAPWYDETSADMFEPAVVEPVVEFLAELAGVMHVEGAGTGWADAQDIDGSVRIQR